MGGVEGEAPHGLVWFKSLSGTLNFYKSFSTPSIIFPIRALTVRLVMVLGVIVAVIRGGQNTSMF